MKAAEKEIGMIDLENLVAPDTVDYSSAREGKETPLPLTPNTQGLKQGAKPKKPTQFLFNSRIAKESKNLDPNKLQVPQKQTWAQMLHWIFQKIL